MARKNKYETYVRPRLIEVQDWVRNGMIDRDVAKRLGIGYTTFREYVKKHKELAEVMRLSKGVADAMVVNALFKSALGYDYEEVKEERVPVVDEEGRRVVDEEGKERYVIKERTVTQKHVQGDVRAQQFWLKNRLPEDWRDRIENSISGALAMNVDDDALAKMIKEAGFKIEK